jgi:hypothetical protein
MANIFKPKRSSVSSSVPTVSNLADGEIAVNSADKIIYLREGASIIPVGKGSDTVTFSAVPTSSADTGTIGQVAKDSTYLYVCVATDTWERIFWHQASW